MLTPLTGRTVLIVDDEPFIAMALAEAIEDLGGQVAGPYVSVSEALAGLATNGSVDGAILDLNLGDGTIGPVLDVIATRGIPAVIQTGYSLPMELKARHPNVPVFSKPAPFDFLAERLCELIEHRD